MSEPDETFTDMLERHEREWQAHLRFVATTNGNDLENREDLGRLPVGEEDLESDIREIW